jgi:hypothetical protein
MEQKRKAPEDFGGNIAQLTAVVFSCRFSHQTKAFNEIYTIKHSDARSEEN